MPPPTFLCVGMPKCGTSTLHDVLARQDEIFVPPIKEIKFLAADKIQYSGSLYELLFSKHWAARQDRLALLRTLKTSILRESPPQTLLWSMRYAFGRRNLSWYFSLFPCDRVSGEISPVYATLGRQEIGSIAASMPDLKIIILLRSPLQQIWSHCRMVVLRSNAQAAGRAFNEHIDSLTRTRRTYRSLVEDWSSQFDGRVFVGYLEDMTATPARFFADVLHFLGIEKDEEELARDPFVSTARSYVGLPHPVPDDVRATLAEHASIRLQGFEAIAPERAAQWRADIDDFQRSRRAPS